MKVAALPIGLVTRRRPKDVVILLYHRVGHGSREIELPVAVFERHLAHLAAHEPVLTLTEALAPSAGGGVVITFDDGYRDFHDRVVPLLVKYRLPALLYLATGLVDGQGPVGGSDRLTWSHLAGALSTGMVTVGAHTHSHANLALADGRTCAEEMRRSKELIEGRLGVPCRDFAYPFGVASPAAERLARELFRTAALDAWRTNRKDRIDPHRLGRTPILRSDGFAFFRAKVKGLLDGEALAYRALGRGPWRTL